MIGSSSNIDSLFENCKKIQNIIIKRQEDVPFELFLRWRDSHQHLGKFLADEAVKKISRKYDAHIIANPVNPSSFAHFTRNDVQSKTYALREKSARHGIQNGFIIDSTIYALTPLRFPICSKDFFAARKDGSEFLTLTVKSSDSTIQACCYGDGTYIVSDMDLISIVLRNKDNIIIQDPQYGEITQSEKQIIEEINHEFQTEVNRLFIRETPSRYRLIAHGPANRFSNSNASHIHYPITVYAPNEGKLVLGNKSDPDQSLKHLLTYFKQIKDHGYNVHLHPIWNFS